MKRYIRERREKKTDIPFNFYMVYFGEKNTLEQNASSLTLFFFLKIQTYIYLYMMGVLNLVKKTILFTYSAVLENINSYHPKEGH